jgi:melibiose permease/lactose/raffinose/galactose permease
MAASGLFMGHLMNYALFTKTLTAVQFSALTAIMVIARVFDALNDPVMGGILDATRTRWGKFKPWLCSGMILTIIVILVSFANSLQGWSYVALFGLMYFAFSISFTMNDISYWGMLPALASEPNDRNKLMAVTNIMCGIAGFLCGIIVPVFTAGDQALGGSAVNAYAILAVLFCAIMLVTQLITIIGVKENSALEKAKPFKVSAKGIIGIIKNNDQVVWCGILLLIHFFVYMITSSISAVYIYLSFGYQGAYASIFTVSSMVAASFVIFLFTPIAKRFGRKTLARFGTLSSATGSLIMLACGLFAPQGLKFPLIAASNAIIGFGNVFYLVMLVNIANCVEYNEYLHGARNEGVIFSVRAFVSKLGMAIGQFVSMLFCLAIGVLSFTNKISSLENDASKGLITAAEKAVAIEEAASFAPSGSAAALLCFLSLVPAVCMISAYLIYRKKIVLSEERYDEILEELKKRKEQDGAAQTVSS